MTHSNIFYARALFFSLFDIFSQISPNVCPFFQSYVILPFIDPSVCVEPPQSWSLRSSVRPKVVSAWSRLRYVCVVQTECGNAFFRNSRYYLKKEFPVRHRMFRAMDFTSGVGCFDLGVRCDRQYVFDKAS